MASAHDVAAYILQTQGSMSAMKLQKLVYYSQAWHLVWDDAALFPERIEAWANGPVIPSLYRLHRGQFTVDAWQGDPDALRENEKETIDVVLAEYGSKSASDLSRMTHSESPWVEARAGLSPGQRGSSEIPQFALADYYGGLSLDGDDA